jgi:hypothetical protein
MEVVLDQVDRRARHNCALCRQHGCCGLAARGSCRGRLPIARGDGELQQLGADTGWRAERPVGAGVGEVKCHARLRYRRARGRIGHACEWIAFASVRVCVRVFISTEH